MGFEFRATGLGVGVSTRFCAFRVSKTDIAALLDVGVQA